MSGELGIGVFQCTFGCGRPVGQAGAACWPCQSYEEYLMAPRCYCPHDPNLACECDFDCEEDCPADEYAILAGEGVTWADGTDAGQGREAAP